MRLDTDTGLAPVSSLGVVPGSTLLVQLTQVQPCGIRKEMSQVEGAYLMVLLVRRRIHWGIGRFCF